LKNLSGLLAEEVFAWWVIFKTRARAICSSWRITEILKAWLKYEVKQPCAIRYMQVARGLLFMKAHNKKPKADDLVNYLTLIIS